MLRDQFSRSIHNMNFVSALSVLLLPSKGFSGWLSDYSRHKCRISFSIDILARKSVDKVPGDMTAKCSTASIADYLCSDSSKIALALTSASVLLLDRIIGTVPWIPSTALC